MYCYKVTKKKSPFYVILIIIVVLVIVGIGFFSLVNLNKRKNDVQYNIVKTGIIEEEINGDIIKIFVLLPILEELYMSMFWFL